MSFDEGNYWSVEKTGLSFALAKTTMDDFEARFGRSMTDQDDVDEEESIYGLVGRGS